MHTSYMCPLYRKISVFFSAFRWIIIREYHWSWRALCTSHWTTTDSDWPSVVQTIIRYFNFSAAIQKCSNLIMGQRMERKIWLKHTHKRPAASPALVWGFVFDLLCFVFIYFRLCVVKHVACLFKSIEWHAREKKSQPELKSTIIILFYFFSLVLV